MLGVGVAAEDAGVSFGHRATVPDGFLAFRRHNRLRRLGGLPARITLFSIAVLGFGLATAALFAREDSGRPVAAPLAIAAPPAIVPWLEIVRPIQMFSLSGSAFNRLPLRYRARRREPGDARQDVLTFGRFGEDTPFLTLSVLRRDGASETAPAFFVAMARLGATVDLSVTRSALPTLMPTRFGRFAAADLTLAQGTRGAPCLGFRLEQPGGPSDPVAIAGFACGAAGHGMDRALLACVLDRIDLVSAGDDGALRDFFVAAERRRGEACAASRLLASGARDRWLDADATPPALRPWGSRNHTR